MQFRASKLLSVIAMAACMAQALELTSSAVTCNDEEMSMITGYQLEFEDYLGEDFDPFWTTWCVYWQYDSYRTYTVKIAYKPNQALNIHSTLDVYNDAENDPEITCAIDGQSVF